MHIGLIGGIGPAATEHYYRGLIERHASAGTVLDLTIAHADVREMGENLAKGAAQRQAESFARLLRRLTAAGAELAAVTSMGGHFCINELEAISPLPLLNAIPEVDADIRQRNLATIGIIGTRTVMQSGLYGGITSARIVRPEGAALDTVHNTYVAMASAGRVTEAQRRVFFSVGQHLHQTQGAEAIVLGGTDLFLAFAGQECGFPVIDCADVHVEALYRRSVSRGPHYPAYSPCQFGNVGSSGCSSSPIEAWSRRSTRILSSTDPLNGYPHRTSALRNAASISEQMSTEQSAGIRPGTANACSRSTAQARCAGRARASAACLMTVGTEGWIADSSPSASMHRAATIVRAARNLVLPERCLGRSANASARSRSAASRFMAVIRQA
jgi:aspartate racemase